MSSELKPCPICGSQVRIHEQDNRCEYYYWIECPECHCKTEKSMDRVELIDEWNNHRPASRKPALDLCPLCGLGIAYIQYHQGDNRYRVTCEAFGDGMCCGFSTPWMNTKEEAANLWNGGYDIEEDEKYD